MRPSQLILRSRSHICCAALFPWRRGPPRVNPCRSQPAFLIWKLQGFLPCRALTAPIALCAENRPSPKKFRHSER